MDPKPRAPRRDKGVKRGPKKPPATRLEEWQDYFAAHSVDDQEQLLRELRLIQKYQFRDLEPLKLEQPAQVPDDKL